MFLFQNPLFPTHHASFHFMPFGLIHINSFPYHFIPPTFQGKSQVWLLGTQETTMSLNCLTCGPAFQRTDSYRDMCQEDEYRGVCKKVDRSWSGNMTSPKCELPKGGVVAKIKANHRRIQSTSNVPCSGGSEPKLVRSSGMRRDWSFENLVENQDQKIVSCH